MWKRKGRGLHARDFQGCNRPWIAVSGRAWRRRGGVAREIAQVENSECPQANVNKGPAQPKALRLAVIPSLHKLTIINPSREHPSLIPSQSKPNTTLRHTVSALVPASHVRLNILPPSSSKARHSLRMTVSSTDGIFTT